MFKDFSFDKAPNKRIMVFLIVMLIIINVGWFIFMKKRKQ